MEVHHGCRRRVHFVIRTRELAAVGGIDPIRVRERFAPWEKVAAGHQRMVEYSRGLMHDILHAALDETFFCACLRFGNKWTCACCCFSPADAATFASSPSTGTSVKVWNFRVNKLSNSARWSLCACARHCWIAA